MPSLNAMAEKSKKLKATTPKTAPKKSQPMTSTLSSEFIQDSDIEQDENLDESSSDEESSPEEPAVATSKTNGKTVAVAAESSSGTSGSEGSEESGSEEEEDEEDEEPKAKNIPEPARPQVSTPSTTKTVSFEPIAAYKPPTGFAAASVSGQAPSSSQALSKSNLEGKQIWYFTAPASVPINLIKETSLAKISKGKSVLSHNDNDYGFIEDSSEDVTYTKVMAPRASDESYRTAAKPIDRILHLRQIVQLPSVYDANAKQPENSSTARPTIPAKKPVRQQPTGLKMRFLPIGFGDGDTGDIGSSSSSDSESGSERDSDQEMEDAPVAFRRPASLVSSKDSDDDLPSGSDAEMADAPPLPSKSSAKTPLGKLAAKKSIKKTDTSLKRKHSDAGNIPSKNSSSSSEISTNDKALKRVKKTPTNFLVGSQSVSTETPKSNPSKTSRQAASPILPVTTDRNRLPASSSQPMASAKKPNTAPPPKSSQKSLPSRSQASVAHSTPRRPSKGLSQDTAEAKEHKEAKRLKKGINQLSLKSYAEAVANIHDAQDSKTAMYSRFQVSAKEFSSQLQSSPTKEGHSKVKKEKKKDKKSGQQSGQIPASTPARSQSVILPPNSSMNR